MSDIRTVTGELIRLGRFSGYSLNYIIPCGKDLVAEISICDWKVESNNRKTRVFVSQNSGVEMLVDLAAQRGELKIVN